MPSQIVDHCIQVQVLNRQDAQTLGHINQKVLAIRALIWNNGYWNHSWLCDINLQNEPYFYRQDRESLRRGEVLARVDCILKPLPAPDRLAVLLAESQPKDVAQYTVSWYINSWYLAVSFLQRTQKKRPIARP